MPSRLCLPIRVRVIAIATLLPAVPALAAERPRDPPPAVVQKLLECRGIADTGQRLACMDAGVAALAGAVESRAVVVSDQAQVQKARRGLFGIAPAGFRLFGGGDTDSKAEADDRVPDAIEAVISAVGRTRNNWQFTLDDGSRWTQTDGTTMRRDPKPGMKIRIRSAAMGSYLANVEKQTAVRVRRVND
jgi:hypothetical protein